jgi:predicted heme/steroid binding protein
MSQRKFTRKELRFYDGREGRPAFTAYNGLVYDVSNSYFWRGGRHLVVHDAGEDLTAEMAEAPHGIDMLEAFPVVGILLDS